jgi:hypothetical protein
MLAANNYRDVRAEAQAALKIAPNNAQALALTEKVSIREKESLEKAQEQAEARRQEILALPKKTYDFALRVYREAALFDDHELQTALPMTQAAAAIGRQLDTAPAFKWIKTQVPWPESFCISASQDVPGGLRRSSVPAALGEFAEARAAARQAPIATDAPAAARRARRFMVAPAAARGFPDFRVSTCLA